MNSKAQRILMIAAEASSVLYAEQLMRHWLKRGLKNHYFGVGSRSMEAMGFVCMGYAEEMAVVGFSEVIKQYSSIKTVFKKVIEELAREPVTVAVLLDYPGFNLRLAKELHQRKIPVVYYISPQIWAWKKNRIHSVKSYVTKMLVVFPFEVEFYRSHGVEADYVGHPLLDELNSTLMDDTQITLQRGRLGISHEQKVLGLMPGSRRQEIEYHLEVQLQVAEKLYQKHPNIKILLMVAPTLTKDFIQARLGALRFPLIIIQDEPFKMISLADAILAASGTATLMIGLLEKPMVIMYKVSWFTAFIGRRLFKGFFGLVNLLSQKEIVPERFQEQATVAELTPLIEHSLFDLKYRSQVIENLKTLKAQLGAGGVTGRVAQKIEEVIARSNPPHG